jgi:ferredoxin
MHIVIDADKCQGHARCTLIAPNLFDLDDDGNAFLLVDEVPGDQVELAERAVANCPEKAITTV